MARRRRRGGGRRSRPMRRRRSFFPRRRGWGLLTWALVLAGLYAVAVQWIFPSKRPKWWPFGGKKQVDANMALSDVAKPSDASKAPDVTAMTVI